LTAGTAWILVSAIQSLVAAGLGVTTFRATKPSTAGRPTIWAAFGTWRSKCRTGGGPRVYPFQQQMYGKRGLRIDILGQDHIPEEISPYPYKFFYWIDPWGVQWEMGRGRLVDRVVKGIVG
jgi:hypothetical protein